MGDIPEGFEPDDTSDGTSDDESYERKPEIEADEFEADEHKSNSLRRQLERVQAGDRKSRKTGTGVSVTAEPTPGTPDASFAGGGATGASARTQALAQKRKAEQSDAEAKEAADYTEQLWKWIKSDREFSERLSEHRTNFTCLKHGGKYSLRNWAAVEADDRGYFKEAIPIYQGYRGSSKLAQAFGSLHTRAMPLQSLFDTRKGEISFKDGVISITAAATEPGMFMNQPNIPVMVDCAREIAEKEIDMLVNARIEKMKQSDPEAFEEEYQQFKSTVLKELKESGDFKKYSGEEDPKLIALIQKRHYEKLKTDIMSTLDEATLKNIRSYTIDFVNDEKELSAMLSAMKNKEPILHAELEGKALSIAKASNDPIILNQLALQKVATKETKGSDEPSPTTPVIKAKL